MKKKEDRAEEEKMKVKEAEGKLFTLLAHSTPSRTPPPLGVCCLLFCFILATLLGMQDLRVS